MRIITGSTGTTHVTSNDDGEFNQGIFGTDLIVFTNGEQLDAAVVDNNTIRVKDGDLIMQGRHALIAPNTTEDVIIETGAVGVNRNDLIVARYVMDTGTGYEDITLEVVKGTETAGEASDPEYVTGDIRTGSTLVEVPLYRVRITGISIAGIDKLFTPSMSMREMIASLNETLAQHSEEISELNNALTASDETPFRFGVDENGNYGYVITDSEGADTVVPFKRGVNSLEKLFLQETFNKDYTVEDADNVIVYTLSFTAWNGYYPDTPSCKVAIGSGEVQSVCSTSNNYVIANASGNGGVKFNIWLVTNCKGSTLSIKSGGKANVAGWCGVYKIS